MQYKESTTISLAFHDSSYNTLVESTASLFNLDLIYLQNNLYKVTGNMDAIIDFHRILNKEILALPMPSGHSNQVLEATGHGVEEEAPHPQFPLSRYDRFTDQNRDILGFLNKIPDGKFPGVHYFPGEGIVYIEKEDSAKKISNYQSAYQQVCERMKVEVIPLPPESSSEAANEICSLLSSENSKYTQCVFTYDDSTKSMKVIFISSRQFDQAKKVLLECSQFNPASCLTLPLAQQRTLTLKKSDIVKEQVDIVVNAANGRLQHAGGVALAINRASGGAVQQYSDQYMKTSYGEIRVGNVAVTKAGGALKCRYIIHAVGPTVSHYDCKALLEEVTNNILRAAEEKEVSSIAIPAISSGIYGVDKNLVAQCLVDSISSFKFSSPMPVLSDIRIVIIDEPTYRCFADYIQKKLDKLAPTERDISSINGVGSNQKEGRVREDNNGSSVDPTRKVDNEAPGFSSSSDSCEKAKSHSSDSGGKAKSHSSDSEGKAKSHSSDSGGRAKSHSSDSEGKAKSRSSDSGGRAKSHSSDSGGKAKSHFSDSERKTKSHSSDSGGKAKSHSSDSGGKTKSHFSTMPQHVDGNISAEI